MRIATSSGRLTASGVVYPGRTQLMGLIIYTDGTNAATVSLRDGTDSKAKLLAGPFVLPGASYFAGPVMPIPVAVEKALYLDLSGTGAYATVYYEDPGVL